MSMSKKFNRLDKYTKLSVIIILAGIVIRLYLVSVYHISGDACWHLSNSRFIAENRHMPLFEQFGRDEPFWPPPVFHILSAGIYWIFNIFGKNTADFAVKFLSPIFGSLTLILLFLISKDLFDKKIALFATLFFTFLPIHIDYSIFSYVDGMLTFLAVSSVYLALKNKIFLAAIASGLTILTKYNGIFILPVILFIIYNYNKDGGLEKNFKNKALKNLIVFILISLAIGSIWFIRNLVYLGNPVWPFMNNIFHGFEVRGFAESPIGSANLLNILNISGVASIYLGMFGIPDGNINTLSFFDIPYLYILFSLWLFGTIIFLAPFFIGLFSKELKYKGLLFLWTASYIFLIFLYIINASWSVSRFMLPAFPAIALIWAHGMQKIKFFNIRRALVAIIYLSIAGFVLTSFVKVSLAAKAWDFYEDDFKWVRLNTKKDAVFLTGSQCISYNIERQTTSPEINNIGKADYVFVNQAFRPDHRALLDNELLSEIQSKKILVYSNKNTKTEIYR